MNIVLMQNNSEPNKIGKNLTTINTLEGSIKEPSSIINPDIMIDYDYPSEFNYVHIPAFNRYYFVKDVTVVRNHIIIIHLKVDVLESFKNQILSQNVIIDKNELGDRYLIGENWVRNVKTKTDIINFPSGLLDSGEFILITAGG